MPFPIILAHGALGAWDEIIFLGVASIFLIMMGISWIRSRVAEPELEETAAPEESPSDPAATTDSPSHVRLE